MKYFLMLFFALSINCSYSQTYHSLSIEKAKEKALEENKKILLFFTAKWCGPCQYMKNNVLNDPQISIKLDQEFVLLKITDGSFQDDKLSKLYPHKGIPFFVILDNSGKWLNEVNKKMEIAEFFAFLSEVKSNRIEVTPANEGKYFGAGLRSGFFIKNLDNHSNSIGYNIDLIPFTFERKRFSLKTAVGFHSKGAKGESLNYIQFPVYFGYTINRSSIFLLSGGYRIAISPYYSILVNDNGRGYTDDYGVRISYSPFIGNDSKIELEFFYEQGFNDINPLLDGQQQLHQLGLNMSLVYFYKIIH